VKAKANILAGRRSTVTLVVVALVVAEILYGVTVGVLAGYSHLALIAVMGVILVVVTFIEPVFGLYVFVATIFTEALLLLSSVSATRLVGIVVTGAWIARSLSHRRFEVMVPRQGWFIVMFATWGLFSAMWAMDTQKLFTAFLLLVQSITSYILIVNLADSTKRIQIILGIIVVVSLALALLTVARVFRGELTGGRADLKDVSGGGPHSLAASLLPGAALLIILSSHEAHLAKKLSLLLGLSVVVLAVLATSTRAAMVSLACIMVLGLIVDRKTQGLVPLILLVGGGALFFLPNAFSERAQSILTWSDRGAGRIDIWTVALQIIRSHPIQGVGLDNFGKAFDKYLSETAGVLYFPGRGMGSHNIWLNVLSELGVIGFVLFAVFVGMTVKSGLVAMMNLRQAGDSDVANLATAVWLGLIGVLVMGLAVDLQYWKLFWLLMALPEALRRLSVESPQETAF
jgi:O-antigen ligase